MLRQSVSIAMAKDTFLGTALIQRETSRMQVPPSFECQMLQRLWYRCAL